MNDRATNRQTGVMGVTGISPLVSLSTVSIPDCSPFDVMHLVYLGFTRDLCHLLKETYFTPAHPDLAAIEMPTKVWEALGSDMAKIEAPVSWGRYKRLMQLLM